jgi:hypothetical protein
MTPKGYTTKSQIENYLLTTVNPIFHTQLNDWIAIMETHLDKVTGRNFIAETVASEKLYDGNGERELIIDDSIEITKVEIEDEELDAEEYFVYPANNTPKNVLRRADGGVWPRGNQNTTITAKWGYSEEVPNDIVFACTVLVAGIINYSSKDSQSQVETKSIGRYSVTYKNEKEWQDFDQINKIINLYKKFTF